MSVSEDKVCKRWREYLKDLIRDDGERRVSIGNAGIDVR